MASIAIRRIINFVALLLISQVGSTQFKLFYIKDKRTNEPLAYASVFLLKENKVLYTDSIGKLFLEEKIIQQNDSIRVSFINYRDTIILSQLLAKNSQIFLERSFNQLNEIIINNCNQDQILRITNKYGTIRSSNGAGFNIPVKLLGYYPNETGKEGWLYSIEFYASSVKQADAKLRIHWYEWDELKHEPGRDLTDTSIIVSGIKNGWNEIKIPENRVYIDQKGIVLGFDMIYPSDIIKNYLEIKDTIESRKYRFKYNWFLRTDITFKKEGFHLFKETQLFPSNFSKENKYHKPAIHLYIKTCLQ